MKKIGIEELLTWAFTVELPKIGATEGGGPGFASGSAACNDYATYGTIIDRSPNQFGVVPYFSYEGDPHPDAVEVGRMVGALKDREFEIGDGWAPFPEWDDPHGLIAPEIARIAAAYCGREGTVNGRHIVTLVTSCAVLRRGPDWSADAPKVVMVSHSGKPAWFVTRYRKDRAGVSVAYEDNGFDARMGRPRKGAYRKYRIDGSIRSAVIGRMEWQLWQSALSTLCESLVGRFEAHDLAPFVPDMHPWGPSRASTAYDQAIEMAR